MPTTRLDGLISSIATVIGASTQEQQ